MNTERPDLGCEAARAGAYSRTQSAGDLRSPAFCLLTPESCLLSPQRQSRVRETHRRKRGQAARRSRAASSVKLVLHDGHESRTLMVDLAVGRLSVLLAPGQARGYSSTGMPPRKAINKNWSQTRRRCACHFPRLL